jgi:hypothetical protein
MITLSCTVLGLLINFFISQVFCVPIFWASTFCIAFIISLLLIEFVRSKYLRIILYFFIGCGIPICIYCIIFLANPWAYFLYYFYYIILGTFYFCMGLFALLPFYFLFHIWQYYKIASKLEVISALSGASALIMVFIVFSFGYHSNYGKFEEIMQGKEDLNNETKLELINKNYFLERLLGIGFKYHTEIEPIIDGWRPPLHDPFLNAYLWISNDTYYPYGSVDLPIRVQYYHKLFPNEPLKVKCPCSYNRDGRGYLEHWIIDYKTGRTIVP